MVRVPKPNPIRLFSWGLSSPVVRNDIRDIVGRTSSDALHVWKWPFWTSLMPVFVRSGLGRISSTSASLIRVRRCSTFTRWDSSSVAAVLVGWDGAVSPFSGVGPVVGVLGALSGVVGVLRAIP